MSGLSELKISDHTETISVVSNPPGYRKSRVERPGAARGTVIHYNGPEVSFRSDLAKVLNFVLVQDTKNHQQRIGMDSNAYHYVVLDDGSIHRTRPDRLQSWHAANSEANTYYIAIHCPIGGAQEPTPAQWAAVVRLHEALAEEYGFPRERMTGHLEWSSTKCPGRLMPHIKQYREGLQAGPGTPIAGPPTISPQRFAQELSEARSPAAAAADALYRICTSEGINPAVALAFFEHESSYGKAGITLKYNTKNWGNVRSPEVPGLGVTIQVPGRGNFAKYATWENGLLDWCKRLLGPKYAGAGLMTVETVLPKYAPSSDGNAPAKYAAAVRASLARWAATESQDIVWKATRAVNIRTRPRKENEDGSPVPIVRTAAKGESLIFDEIKTTGDAQEVSGSKRWGHLKSGEGFVWLKESEV